MNPSIVDQLFKRRLEKIGCDRLPAHVLRVLREHIDAAALKAVTRIVEREVSTNKIARIFARGTATAVRRGQGGFEGEVRLRPLDQSALLDLPPQIETRAVTGTAARQLPSKL
jgi:hypothetical protein